jgi:prepilin-type N-terminal cleavage/methylation domain-containing protein
MSLFTPSLRRYYSGFTLAELLIALAILGVIATFTIPKLLQSQQNQQKQAVLKETISIVSNLAYTYCRDDIKSTGISIYDYYTRNVSGIKLCPTDGIAEGCIATNSYGTEGIEGALTLANGASIGGLNLTPYLGAEGIIVDWNGLNGTNTAGDDQLRLYMLTTCTGTWNGVRAPRIGASSTDPTSLTMYQTIFSQ